MYMDSGNEWKGIFKNYLNENNIYEFHAEIGNQHSIGIIDRFSKTIKTNILHVITQQNSIRFYL